jgi:Leucine-rich repeat (LRR) protein
LFVYDITNFYIPSIKNLKELKLESIYSKDFNFAKNVKQIESLTLNDYVLESFKEFNNFKNLKKLKIANSQIRNVDIEYIKDLPLFESIEIINCDIDEADVNRLERLKNIKSFKYEPKQIIEYE